MKQKAIPSLRGSTLHQHSLALLNKQPFTVFVGQPCKSQLCVAEPARHQFCTALAHCRSQLKRRHACQSISCDATGYQHHLCFWTPVLEQTSVTLCWHPEQGWLHCCCVDALLQSRCHAAWSLHFRSCIRTAFDDGADLRGIISCPSLMSWLCRSSMASSRRMDKLITASLQRQLLMFWLPSKTLYLLNVSVLLRP